MSVSSKFCESICGQKYGAFCRETIKYPFLYERKTNPSPAQWHI